MPDLLRRESAGGAPWWHRRVRKRGARVVDLRVQIVVAEPAISEGGEVRPDIARRPHIVARHEVAARTGRLGARHEQRAPLRGIARETSRHRRARHRRLRPLVAIRVRAERAVVLRRPALVADGRARAVRHGPHVATRLGDRPRRLAGGGAAREHRDRENDRGPGRHGQDSLMSAVPSYLPPAVSMKVTVTLPGSATLSGNAKKGFSLTLWVVSKDATVLPAYVATTLVM